MSVGMALLAAHMLGDFPLQTDAMAEGKFESLHQRAVHSWVHMVLATLFTWPFLTNAQTALVGPMVLVLHFAIDTRRWAEPKDGFEVYPIAVDQAYHVASLFVVILVVTWV